MRWRIAGTSTFDSSKRKAAMMCSFSAALWLLKNSRACVKWSSKEGLRRRTLGDSIASGKDWKPPLAPSTRNSLPSTSELRLVGHLAARDGLAVHAVALEVVEGAHAAC